MSSLVRCVFSPALLKNNLVNYFSFWRYRGAYHLASISQQFCLERNKTCWEEERCGWARLPLYIWQNDDADSDWNWKKGLGCPQIAVYRFSLPPWSHHLDVHVERADQLAVLMTVIVVSSVSFYMSENDAHRRYRFCNGRYSRSWCNYTCRCCFFTDAPMLLTRETPLYLVMMGRQKRAVLLA